MSGEIKSPAARQKLFEYFDNAITSWRGARERAKERGEKEQEFMATCYVDAFQSARISLLGEPLPE